VVSGTYAKAAYEIKTEFRAAALPSVATDFTDLTKSKLQGTNVASTTTATPTFGTA